MSREDDEEFQEWAREVKIRDEFTCQICDTKGGIIEAHHLNAWNAFPEQRFDVGNGRSLCKHCHKRFHDTYGYGGNTEYQYYQYEEVAETFRRILRDNRIKKLSQKC
jgi:5-methylcytosine-specific restriction endonuclease McrA